MNGIDQALNQAADLADANAQPRPGDYKGPNGLLICGECGTPKQCRVKIGGKERTVGCLCRCGVQRRNAQAEELQRAHRLARLERLRQGAIGDAMLRDASFARAKPTALISKAERYVENWELVRQHNVGLLLIGGVGVGKSYAAACICNALLDRGVSCLMTGFVRILAMDWDDRDRMLSTLDRYELLVLDDLGAERDTSTAREGVFRVVDQRYRAKKPMIVTTNLSQHQLKTTKELDLRRIYDRLLEVCGPVGCDGDSLRAQGGSATRQLLREVFRTT